MPPSWLDLIDTFGLYVFIPTVPLLLLGLLIWAPAVVLLCVFPIAAFTMLYGELFLPRPAPVSTAGTTFRVMTYNVLGMNRSFQSIAQLIEDENPDVIAIQELTPEIATPLAHILAAEYPYQALDPRADFSGIGLFSRFPIKEKDTFMAFSEGSLSQHLVLNVYGRDVHLLNLHPNHPHVMWTVQKAFPPFVVRHFDTDWQDAQVESMMEKADSIDGPLIALGDFNLTDQTRQYRRITRNLKDSYREAGRGFGHTFPANGRVKQLPLPWPVVRIDYVFHSDEFRVLKTHLGDNAGSDHYPVIVDLAFKEAER